MPRINQILQSKFDFTEDDIAASRLQAAQKNESYASYLLRKNLLTEDQLLALHSEAFDIPILAQLPVGNIDNRFTDKIPIHYLKKYAMVPLGPCQAEDAPSAEDPPPPCLIVMGDPGCVHQLDDLVHLLDLKQYELALASRQAILNAINLAYDLKQDSAEKLVQDMENSDLDNFVEIEVTADLLDETSDAPIIRLVNNIISQSAKARASDIHIEPSRDQVKVRYRIDGVLYDLLTPPKHIQSALISRIKVMAKLDIAEKRLPQDGRFDVKIGNTEIDVRVSTIPTAISAVSRSRISPTRITSGSWRTIDRRPLAKVSPILGLTWIWLMPSIWYSTGSSTVMMLMSGVLMWLRTAYSEVVFPLPVGPVTRMMPLGAATRRFNCVIWRSEAPRSVMSNNALVLFKRRMTTRSPAAVGMVDTRTSISVLPILTSKRPS